MGTRSKMGWNDRCTVRGPQGDKVVVDALEILTAPKNYVRRERMWAKKVLRKYIKFVTKHVPGRRNAVQREILSFRYLLEK